MTQEPAADDTQEPRTGGSALLTNSASLMASRLVVAGLGWAGTILIIRSLTPEEWGQFSFVFSLLGMLSFFTELGSSRVVLSRMARDSADAGRFAGTYIMLRATLGLLSYLVAIGFVVIAGYPPTVVLATVIAGVIMVIASFSSGLDVVFQASLRMGTVAVANVVGQLVQLALTALIAVTDPILLLFVLPAIAYDVVAMSWKVRFIGRVLPVHYGIRLSDWAFILRQAAPLALAAGINAVSSRVDVLVIAHFQGFEAVGFFNVAIKFASIVVFLPSAMAAPLLTILVRHWPGDRPAFRSTVNQGLHLMALSAGLVLVGFIPFAGPTVTLLYGATYTPAALAAQLAVVAACISFISWVGSAVFITLERNRSLVAVAAVALAASIAANVALVPTYSYNGSAVAHIVVALIDVGLIGVLLLRGGGCRHLALGPIGKVALVTVAGLATGFILAERIPWPLALAVAVAVYLGGIEVTGATGDKGLRDAVRAVARRQPPPNEGMGGEEPARD